jgi:acetamidase/formamidase
MSWPRAETPTHYITMGFSPDLKEATEHALRDMIDFLVEEKHMTRDDAYMLSSVAVDLDITQLVDDNVGVHAICRRISFPQIRRSRNFLWIAAKAFSGVFIFCKQ